MNNTSPRSSPLKGKMDSVGVDNSKAGSERSSPTKTITSSLYTRLPNENSPFRRPNLNSPVPAKSPNGENSGKRIVYNRDVLLQFRNTPVRAKKLEIPQEVVRVKKPTSPSDFISPDRKRAGGGTPTPRKDNSQSPRDDSISLRPHSGNFSSGCTPNLSPNNGPFLSRFHTQEDQSKPFFDRDHPRNQFRYPPPMRMDPQDRGKERARDGRGREERPMRDFDSERTRESRDGNGRDRERPGIDQDRSLRGVGTRGAPIENGRRTYGQGYTWGDESGDWNRRKPNEHNRYRREYNDRDRHSGGMEQEPEWFSEGPITYNDTIELRGFHDDHRQEQPKAGNENNTKKDLSARMGAGDGPTDVESEIRKNSPKPEETAISLDKILAMDQIPGILTNGLLEHEEPSGSSRFSQLFQRYSESSLHELNGVRRSSSRDKDMNSTAEEGRATGLDMKKQTAKDIESALRNILLTKPPEEQERAKEDVKAFKKLLDQIVVKGASHSDSPQTNQSVPKPGTEGNPMSEVFARLAKLENDEQPKPRGDFQAIFSNFFARAMGVDSAPSSSHPSHGPRRMPPNMQVPQRPVRPQNSSMDGFRPVHAGMPRFPPRNPHPGLPEQMKFQHQQRPSFSAFEVLNLLPLEMQSLVLGAKIGPEFMKRADVMQIVNALNTGEVILGDIIQQLGAPHNPHKLILAGVLKLGLNGVIPIPGLVYAPVGVPAHLPPNKLPPNAYPPHPAHQHFGPHPHFPMHPHNHMPPTHIPNQGNPHHGQPHFNGSHPGF